MNLIKKISITFFLILSLFVFSNMAMSQTVSADLPEPHVLNQAELDELNNMPSVQTYNFKLDKAIYKAGDTVKGTFFIKNDRNYNLPDLKYTVSLAGEYDKRTGLPAMVYDSKSFGPVFLAGSEESKEVNFSYTLPEAYAGDNFGIQIKTFTNAGIPLGWNSVLIKINGVSGVLKIDSAYIEVDGQKFSLQEGPTIKEEKKGEVHIFVSNPLKESVSVSGKINIYNRTITGKILGTYNTEFIEIKSGGKQEFVLDLNKYISEPGVYEGSFIILDKDNVVRAQEIKFRYIIWGNIVTIQKVVADKEFINRGEIVNLDISYTGSPFDITNGEVPEQKPMNTKIVLSDLKENVVANYEGLIDYNKGTSIKIPLIATKNADYIKIGLTVYDDSGKVVTSYNSVLSDTTKERVQDSNNWSMIVLLIVIILALTAFVFRGSIKKRILSLFLVLFFVLGCCQGANAGIITWTSGTGSVQNYISSQLYNSTTGGSSLTIAPGDQFTVSGTITTLSCNNTTQLNANTKARYNIIGKTSIDINTNGITAYTRTDFNATYDYENYSYTFPSSGYFSTTTPGTHRIPVQFLVFYSGAPQGTQVGYIEIVVTAPLRTITFDKNDAYAVGTMPPQSINQSSSASLTLNTYSKTGFTFSGWATSPSGLVVYTNGASYTMGSSNVTLYAKWTANTYTVILDKQGGSGGTGSVTATYGSAMPTATAPTRGTDIFGGYYTLTGGDGSQYYNSIMTSVRNWDMNSNTTLYAKWTISSPTTYTVTFDSQGATVPASPTSITVTANAAVVTLPTAPTKTGYTFGGWWTLANGEGTEFTVATSVISNITVFANWAATYTVTYHGNGKDSGDVPVDSLLYHVGDTVNIKGNIGVPPLNSPLVRAGYSFAGWSAFLDGSEIIYNSGGTPPMPAGNVNLYAKWDNSTFIPTCCSTRGSTT
ncbi:MAG: InlB B-repeat-containing protein, partial [Candidatus Taylorbacteria bacterium]|nr:InlB B-repeat-containing protein [Candidatus Taylorbacteria bacterium]